MANSRNSKRFCEYATVDTAPAGGYFTNAVYPRKNKTSKLFFSIRDTVDDSTPSVIKVKLQFKCPDDAGWTNHLNGTADWVIGTRILLNEWGEGVAWRAGVEDNGDYTSGSVTFGFDW